MSGLQIGNNKDLFYPESPINVASNPIFVDKQPSIGALMTSGAEQKQQQLMEAKQKEDMLKALIWVMISKVKDCPKILAGPINQSMVSQILNNPNLRNVAENALNENKNAILDKIYEYSLTDLDKYLPILEKVDPGRFNRVHLAARDLKEGRINHETYAKLLGGKTENDKNNLFGVPLIDPKDVKEEDDFDTSFGRLTEYKKEDKQNNNKSDLTFNNNQADNQKEFSKNSFGTQYAKSSEQINNENNNFESKQQENTVSNPEITQETANSKEPNELMIANAGQQEYQNDKDKKKKAESFII